MDDLQFVWAAQAKTIGVSHRTIAEHRQKTRSHGEEVAGPGRQRPFSADDIWDNSTDPAALMDSSYGTFRRIDGYQAAHACTVKRIYVRDTAEMKLAQVPMANSITSAITPNDRVLVMQAFHPLR